jgi:type IV pilus assembly protein PilZ
VRDKRQYQRAELAIDVIVQLKDGTSVPARSCDVSQGGMFISSKAVFAFGTEVTIVCLLPRLEGARLPAIVRWTKPGGFGVQFGLLGARETHALGQLVRGGSIPG